MGTVLNVVNYILICDYQRIKIITVHMINGLTLPTKDSDDNTSVADTERMTNMKARSGVVQKRR